MKIYHHLFSDPRERFLPVPYGHSANNVLVGIDHADHLVLTNEVFLEADDPSELSLPLTVLRQTECLWHLAFGF